MRRAGPQGVAGGGTDVLQRTVGCQPGIKVGDRRPEGEIRIAARERAERCAAAGDADLDDLTGDRGEDRAAGISVIAAALVGGDDFGSEQIRVERVQRIFEICKDQIAGARRRDEKVADQADIFDLIGGDAPFEIEYGTGIAARACLSVSDQRYICSDRRGGGCELGVGDARSEAGARRARGKYRCGKRNDSNVVAQEEGVWHRTRRLPRGLCRAGC